MNMKIKQTLEKVVMGLALTSVLAFSGCSSPDKTKNLSKEEKEMYSKIYNASESDWKSAEKDARPFLNEFSAKKEMYTKKAENYPWMNPKNLTERDIVYIVLDNALGEIAVTGAGYIQAQGRAVSPNYKEAVKDSNSRK